MRCAFPANPMNQSLRPEDFLEQAARTLDWSVLHPWLAAVETKAGTPLSIALFKMVLLKRWFGLSEGELDDACHARAAFRRFLGAPLHGPVAEVWMFRQFRDVLGAADTEVQKLLTAVELILSDRGVPPRPGPWPPAVDDEPIDLAREGVSTTVFDPGQLGSIATEAEEAGKAARAIRAAAGTAAHAAGPAPDASAEPGEPPTDRLPLPGSRPQAYLELPWGKRVEIDPVLLIGRDPQFSPLARQLWADARISRRHAELELTPQGVWLRDLGSSNGTYVDREVVPRGSALLLSQDVELQFGTTFSVRLVVVPAE